jgi:HSP20 family molecular chaperone IbpA
VLWASDNQVIVEAQRGEQKFTNRYTIDERYDPHTATASMAHGLLKVRIKLAPDRKTRRIDIVQG